MNITVVMCNGHYKLGPNLRACGWSGPLRELSASRCCPVCGAGHLIVGGLEMTAAELITAVGGASPAAAATPTRPSWPETWMAIARTIAERSYDPRLKVGAIVVSVDNTQVLSGGYNGNHAGGPHEHESPEPGMSGFIHAEVNALVKLDFNFTKEKHMYVTHSPCRMCAKLIINAGIKRVVYGIAYRDPSGVDLLRSMNVPALTLEEAINTPHVPRPA